MKKRMHKPLVLTSCLALLLGMLSGCSGAASSQAPQESAPSPAQSAEQSTAGAGGASGTLTIYTNSGSDGRDAWLTEQAKEAGFDVVVMQLPGGDLANRAIAEKNNQVADLVFGLNSMEYERMKGEDLFAPYEPVWVDGVDETLVDPDGFYYPIVIQPLLMVYNTDFYTAETAPTDWPDLATNPEYSGKYNVLGLGGGTSKIILVGILSRYTDPAGELGISQEGWDVVKQFVQNGHIEQEGEDWFATVVSGERPICELWGSGLLQRMNEQNLTNLDFVVPEVGVPYVVEQVAIFKNSPNIELAKEFIDWFGSADFQAKWSQEFGSIPAQADALAASAPEVQDMMERVHPQDIDWKFASENIEGWTEKIQLEFVL